MRSLTVDECDQVGGGLMNYEDWLKSGGMAWGGSAFSGSDGGIQEVVISVQRDYCGTGFTSGLVPDAPLGNDFSKACKMHDMLYSALNGPMGKHISDAAFLAAMLSWCDRNAPGDRDCRALAYSYFAAVVVFGGPAYAFSN